MTGGSRGIGAAICLALAGAGARVAVNYRSDVAGAENVRAQIGAGASLWPADISDEAQVTVLARSVQASLGVPDVLVLNAAQWFGGRIEHLKPEEWSAVMRTSLDSAYYLCHELVPAMRVRKWGRIIVISSVVGLIGFPGDSAYATVKSGLLGLVKALAKELGRDGITVNAVAPGFVETEMTSHITEGARVALLGRCSIPRPGQPAEVADGVMYLARAGYTTGQVLVVDGGMSL